MHGFSRELLYSPVLGSTVIAWLHPIEENSHFGLYHSTTKQPYNPRIAKQVCL